MAQDETQVKPQTQEHLFSKDATHLGSTSFFNGSLEAHEDILIDGQFKGQITLPSGTLTVARGAKVEAEVKVRTFILHGDFTGTVTAAERVLISETARMSGDITTPKITISNGAQFKGGIKMGK